MSMVSHKPLLERLFDEGFRLIDGTDEIFELDLALWEYESLSKRKLIERSAYFKTVNGQETAHYRTCNLQNLEEVHKDSSFRTKIFFLDGKYTTGYATHGLFPYRGKFHPQLIRALLNVLRIHPGRIVLDPMAGSATVAVEANLLGIDSVAVDLSPFCGLMGRVKTFALNLDSKKLESLSADPARLLKRLHKDTAPKYFSGEHNDKERNYYEVVMLAFLDALADAASDQKRKMDFIIPDSKNPVIIIECSFLATTSSGQGDKAKTEIMIGDLIKKHHPTAAFIGFVDGIGWFVREGDLRRMVGAYHDVFTFHPDELARFDAFIAATMT